ncbi:MAG: hypothetical protein ACYDC6_15050 [Acidobacteriaceae bacterium]
MSIQVYPDTKVYILLPGKGEAGGSELLHQLVYTLRTHLNIDASLYWPFDATSNPIAEAYVNYNNPIVYSIEDTTNNTLLYPEAYSIASYVAGQRNINKVMWWLSVDNFYISMMLGSRVNFFFHKCANKLCGLLRKEPVYDLFMAMQERIPKLTKNLREDRMARQAHFHFCQSFYARNLLTVAGFPAEQLFYLSDYLNEDFLKTKTSLSGKENIVAYNPQKGFSFTKKIIKYGSGVTFIPLINMSRKQMIETLQRAKVYIDFGNHPGKDRIPREAAILGCCVITGKRGSAAFYDDVSILEEYKFDDKEVSIHRIISKVKDCLENFEERYKDFEHYRRVIKDEPSKFIVDLKKIFVVQNDPSSKDRQTSSTGMQHAAGMASVHGETDGRG